jgi:serine/threonine protein kinase
VQDFSLLDGYWEAMRAGAAASPEEWAAAAGTQAVAELRVLKALHDTEEALREDSSPRTTIGDLPRNWVGEARQFLAAGTVLAEYRIERLLGYGGMGEVYLAEHELMGRKVAVKVLPAKIAEDQDAMKRFRKELKAQGWISPYEHVAVAFDAGIHDAYVYLVMEYVPGMDLKTHVLAAGRLDPPTASEYIRQAALGLAHMHKHGLVHRDIKPSNLMLTPEGNIKILDLGLALLARRELALDLSHTQAGIVLGTVQFMAPEQAEDSRRADPRSDLYSLGCTFYYLLAGQPPFNRPSGIELLRAHAVEPAPSIRDSRPDVPERMAAVIQRLLEKKTEDRYDSARAVAAALGAAAPSGSTGSPSPAQPSKSKRRFFEGKWSFTNRKWTIALNITLAMCLLTAVSLYLVDISLTSIPIRPKNYGRTVLEERKSSNEPTGDLRIGLQVEFYRPHQELELVRLGVVGDGKFAVRQHDRAVVSANFAQPVYPYLIAVNADATCDLLDPRKSEPQRAQEFISPTDNNYWTLDDAGPVAFVIVAAEKSLPPFDEWKPRVPAAAWREQKLPVPWQLDGRRLQPLVHERGVRESEHGPKVFSELCEGLKKQAGVVGVSGVVFEVRAAALLEKNEK